MKLSPSLKVFGGAIVLIAIALIYFISQRSKSHFENKPRDGSPVVADSTTTDNNETAPEPQPEREKKDGSVSAVKAYLKRTAFQPEKIIYLEWSEISLAGKFWKVRCKYVSNTSFHAEVTTNAWFYIQDNKVVRTQIISKI